MRLLPYLQHSFWFLPNVAACHAMANLLAEKHNTFWHDYEVVVAAGASAGIGLEALPPVRKAIGSGFETKTITLSCGKLTTGVTVPQWSSILMLRNLKSPETYFQAAFRVQSPWSIKNPNGDNPNEEEILKPVCFVFDFAPTRALRQLSEYGIGLSPNEPNPENAVKDLVSFLPVLAYDGANMTQIDAGGILDIAMAGTSATLLARKWESALLVNVDNDTLRRILDNPEAMAAVERIEGWRALGDNIIETIINKSEKVKELKNKAKDKDLTEKQKKQLTEEEKEYKSKRKLVQEKLIKFATRIPAFMYLTDFRENTLQDVITKLEPDLFPGRHRPDGEGLPPARAPEGVQHRADEPGRVRVPPLRRRLAPLYGHREPRGPDPLRALRHRGLQLRDRRLRDAEPIGQLRLGQSPRLTERHQILRHIDRRKFFLDLRLKRWRLVNEPIQPLVSRHNGRLLSHRPPLRLLAKTSLCNSRIRRRTAAGMSSRFFTIPSSNTICWPGRNM